MSAVTPPAPPSPSAAPPHATLRVHPERAVPDDVPDILADGLVAHVGFVDDGRPVVIPMTYHADRETPGRLYLHGGHHSRLMGLLRAGAEVCVTVTIVDALIYSRTAINHSMNYRSVVCFARAAADQPDADEQRRMVHAMIARYHPGRAAGVDYTPITDSHLRATAFVALDVRAVSAKAHQGGPSGPRDADPSAPGSAGVVNLRAG
jgi:hypothetical protein